MRESRSGFTIIELIVVIALIGMIFAIVSVTLDGVRAKSRDAKRLSDVKEIQKALSLYDISHGAFPIATTPVTLDGTDPVSLALESDEAIPTVPADPSSPAYSYVYESDAQGNSYTISFCLETNSIQTYAQGCGNILAP